MVNVMVQMRTKLVKSLMLENSHFFWFQSDLDSQRMTNLFKFNKFEPQIDYMKKAHKFDYMIDLNVWFESSSPIILCTLLMAF